MGDDDPHHNTSCSGSTSGASSSSPSLPPAVVTPLPPPAPPPFPSAGPIPTAIAFPRQPPPLQPPPSQQLLQQYQLQQLQQQQQQRVFSFHLSSAAVASTSPSTPASLPLKHPLPLLSASPSPAPAFASAAPADRHARDDYWSEAATFTLIQAWGDCYLELNRGNLKQKHWRDVADAVNRRADASKAPKTDIQCKNRIDTLKKKYKLEKSKTVIVGPRKWTFFERLDELIGASKKPKKPMPVKARPSVPLLPAPAAISLPAKRSLEDTDQGPPQFHPPFGPASTNYCPSSAANQVTPSHTGRTPNHAITGSNHVVSAPYHTTIVPYNAGNSPHHVGNARNQFASNTNHVASAVDATSKSKEGPDTEDSSPNGESAHLKRPKRNWPYADPMHDLAQAITKFGEVYERTEIARQQMSAEIEKQRMIFAKDLELQRLQFFTQTQLELAKLRAKFKRGQAENDS